MNQAISSKGRCERLRDNAIFRECQCPLYVTIKHLRLIIFTRLVFFSILSFSFIRYENRII